MTMLNMLLLIRINFTFKIDINLTLRLLAFDFKLDFFSLKSIIQLGFINSRTFCSVVLYLVK